MKPAPDADSWRTTATGLPANVYLGTSSWSFPGWEGIVYGAKHSKTLLSREGLSAYAKHPLLRSVGVDRTFYAPIAREEFAAYRARVPDSFRFLVKAFEGVTTPRWPRHRRYGERAGSVNEHFLDPKLALEHVVAPARDGLGGTLGVLLFQFPPHAPQEVDGSEGFAERLERFFRALPDDVPYAVEIRTRPLLAKPYADALSLVGVDHGFVHHPRMPSISEQRACVGLPTRVGAVRWMLGGGRKYDEAKEAFAPFNRRAAPDAETLGEIARLVDDMVPRVPVMVVVNNKAEGSAPLSVRALAQRLAANGQPPSE